MKQLPFERPTDHYDERIQSIDEKICELFQKRKDLSDHNPGFPPFELISDWAKKFGLYEELLKSVFGTLRNEEQFKPIIEPKGYKKHISVLKSVEKNNRFYTVPFIRQFENASVVQLTIDWNSTTETPGERPHHTFFELFIGDKYDCRMINGSGSSGHESNHFVVSPSLPDKLSGLDLVFREFRTPFKEQPTGLEIVMMLD
jgi:hypothetical protein